MSSVSRLGLLLLGFTVGGTATGCRRRAAESVAQPSNQAASPAAETVKQSFASLKKQFDDLQKSFADLGKQVEQLPPDLPGYPQLRSSYYGFEEARGVTDAKVTVLSGRLDAALQSGQPEQLQQVSTDIAKAQEDGRRLGELYIKLLHQTMAFQRAADAHKDARRDDAPPAPAGPNGASKKRL